jgi:DNA invertase Pin-like site-specific DNA recombinase
MSELKSTQDLLGILQAAQPSAPKDVDTSTVRYALYTRKSTTSEDRQASSIEDQIDDCYEKVIIPNGLNVVKTYQESYSAKVADLREQFNAMVKEIESGNIDGIIAWHPDRLSRNMKEAGAIIDLVDRGAVKDLQFATFTFENTPAGKMLLGITFVMAKEYSEHLAESVDRGNKRAVEGGEFIGKFKHGYVLDINRYFRPDPLNFPKVEHMFEMALSGKSQKDIRLWINEQSYTVQKLHDGKHLSHIWDKDDVSKLLRDPHYVGVHKWGINHTDLTDKYDFKPMLTVDEFLTINRIDSLDNSKILAMHSPRGGETKADMLRGKVYCGECGKTLTSMLLPKYFKGTLDVKEYRYYYKCETEGCSVFGKSARAKFVIDAAQEFFAQYLFVTESNYEEYLQQADIEAKKKSVEFDSIIAKSKVLIANKERVYDQTKELILKNPELKEHYSLDKHAKEIDKLKAASKLAMKQRDNIKNAIPTFEEYLKLLQSAPAALGKIRDMNTMDVLLRIFFSIHPTTKGTFKGSTVAYKLNEPWKGFVDNDDFVLGAGTGTLTLDLVLGKDAL